VVAFPARAPSTSAVWRVIPLHTLRVLRRCSRCGQTRHFQSSDRFRCNAQQHKLDVWLIYRCSTCGDTWNRPVVERRTPREIGPELLEKYHANDRDLAWDCAFDRPRLASLGVRPEPEVEVRVERLAAARPGPAGDGHEVVLELPWPCGVRLDRLLAAELGASRSALERWLQAGLLQIEPAERGALRRPARDGQRILVREAAGLIGDLVV
jgi:hypothetical protein